MWLMTKYGFFSVVCAHDENGGPHPDLMMIRARVRAHLVALKKEYPELGVIRSTGGTDYPYRIIAPRVIVRDVMMPGLVEEIDYTNFKKEAEERRPKDKAYHNFLHTVWAEGLCLTPRAQGGYVPSYTGPNVTIP